MQTRDHSIVSPGKAVQIDDQVCWIGALDPALRTFDIILSTANLHWPDTQCTYLEERQLIFPVVCSVAIIVMADYSTTRPVISVFPFIIRMPILCAPLGLSVGRVSTAWNRNCRNPDGAGCTIQSPGDGRFVA